MQINYVIHNRKRLLKFEVIVATEIEENAGKKIRFKFEVREQKKKELANNVSLSM